MHSTQIVNRLALNPVWNSDTNPNHQQPAALMKEVETCDRTLCGIGKPSHTKHHNGASQATRHCSVSYTHFGRWANDMARN